MARTISIGRQDFEKIRSDNCFYKVKWLNREHISRNRIV